MQTEILGIEQIHRSLGAEPIGDHGNPVKNQSLVTAEDFFGRHERPVLGIEFSQSPLHSPGADDKIDFSAGIFLNGIDGGLYDIFADRADIFFDVRFEPGVFLPVYAVQSSRIGEQRAEPRNFIAVGILQRDFGSRGNSLRRERRPVDGEGLVFPVDFQNFPASCGRDDGARRGAKIDDHTFGQSFDAVRGDEIIGSYRFDCAQRARTVPVKHSAEIEGRASDKGLHFVVEQIDESALIVSGSADRLIGNFYRPVEIFEGRDELNVIITGGLGQISGFGAGADAAVDAVSHQFSDVFSPDVGGRAFNLCEERIDVHVELSICVALSDFTNP